VKRIHRDVTSTQTNQGQVKRHDRSLGQALVEFALVLPIVLVLVVSVGDLGLIFGKLGSLGYASREGARTGSALALGDASKCPGVTVLPSGLDAVVIGAVERILLSPDAGIDIDNVLEIRIFKADSSGGEAGPVNIWLRGPGPEIDPGPGSVYLHFYEVLPVGWPVCSRSNTGGPDEIDSIGVTVKYEYDFVTPLPALINAVAGGNLSLTLAETTVMALNPTF
jgi:hypothetical protein